MKNSPESNQKRRQLKRMWLHRADRSKVAPSIIRRCRGCRKMKPCRWNSTFTQTGNPEYKVRCTPCQNKWLRAYTKKHRSRYTRTAQRRRWKAKTRCIEYLGGRCVRCGYSKCQKALTFHHRNEAEKDRSISTMVEWTWDKVRAELDKCDLLCFNCHMEEHCDQDRKYGKWGSDPLVAAHRH